MNEIIFSAANLRKSVATVIQVADDCFEVTFIAKKIGGGESVGIQWQKTRCEAIRLAEYLAS